MEESPTILLVEDDINDLFLIQRSMEKSRLANPVRVVRDGEEAVHYLAGEGAYADRAAYPVPFLVLLDLHLPKLNGFEVLRWVRSRSQYTKLRIAVLTSSSDEHDYKQALELGADSYFVKPGSLDELVHLMLRLRGHWLLLEGQECVSHIDAGSGGPKDSVLSGRSADPSLP
jgi:DNA-binding response OmpR family regulator